MTVFGPAPRRAISWNATDAMLLFPTDEVKGNIPLDSLKIVPVGGHDGRADTSGGKCDQDVKHKIAYLGSLIPLGAPHAAQNLGRLTPVLFRWREHATAPAQLRHELSFQGGARATQ